MNPRIHHLSCYFLCLIFILTSCKEFSTKDYTGSWDQKGNCFEESAIQIISQQNPNEVIIQGFGKDKFSTEGHSVRATINGQTLTFASEPNVNPANGAAITLSGNGKLSRDGKKINLVFYQKRYYIRPDGKTGVIQGQCSGSLTKKLSQ